MATTKLLAGCFGLIILAVGFSFPVVAQQADPAQPAAAAEPAPASIEDELKPRPDLGDRTIDALSPEAQEVLRKRLIEGSNRVLPPVPTEVKKKLYDSMSGSAPMSMRELFNFMTSKKKAKAGLTFDEVVESMDIKANEVNFKKVGHNKFWKDVSAITGVPTTRVEILQYCDAKVGRRMLDFSPEFVIFIPCRIGVYEDANGEIWLMTLDWDVSWLARAWHPDSQLPEQIREDALRIRDAMEKIMHAGATGEW